MGEEPYKGCLQRDLAVRLVLTVLGHQHWVPSHRPSHHMLPKPNIVFSSHLGCKCLRAVAVILLHAHRDLSMVGVVHGKVLMPIKQPTNVRF